MKKFALLAILGFLAACGPDDGDGGKSDSGKIGIDTDLQTDVVTKDPITGGGKTGSNPYPWNRYFVTEFDPVEVKKIRNLPGFVANNLRFVLRIAGHPTYGGAGKAVESNPLAAARLDYALSTGLSGAGQIVSIIDNGIRVTHEQFAGKTIYTSGGPPLTGDFHGTSVASVAAGSGNGGGTLGFAPSADLHLGYLDYNAPVNWSALGEYMRHASALGAVVSNNSWGLTSLTVKDVDVAAYFRNPQRAPYIDGLSHFATDGVIIFALQNEYDADSASLMAGVPLGVPDLEANWISVVNAVPTFDDDRILSAERLSTACLETARFCMTASGQNMVANHADDSSYSIAVGASFAAPQVAGSVALLAEAFPDLESAQIRDRLLATADNGFFTHTGTLKFAPGITHGYNEEFGHGFLDLRSALLPIGQPVVPMADGGSLDLGKAAIAAGPASGDGLSRSLAVVNVVSLDQLHGSFTLSGSALGGSTGGPNVAATALSASTQAGAGGTRSRLNDAIRNGRSLAGHRGMLSDPSAAELLGSSEMALHSTDDGLRVAALGGNGTAGLALSQDLDLGVGALRLGFASMQSEGSVMGVTVPGREADVRSNTHALRLDLVSKIASNTALRLNGEMGSATGNGAGMVTGFSDVSYNRFGVAMDRADVAQSGDVLSVLVRRPVGITRGSARMELPVGYAKGETSFSTQKLQLSPAARQIDLGFEYGAPIGPNGNLTVGMIYSRNHGNIDGQSATSGFVGMHFRM